MDRGKHLMGPSQPRETPTVEQLVAEARRTLDKVAPHSMVETWLNEGGRPLVRLVERLEELGLRE